MQTLVFEYPDYMPFKRKTLVSSDWRTLVSKSDFVHVRVVFVRLLYTPFNDKINTDCNRSLKIFANNVAVLQPLGSDHPGTYSGSYQIL